MKFSSYEPLQSLAISIYYSLKILSMQKKIVSKEYKMNYLENETRQSVVSKIYYY